MSQRAMTNPPGLAAKTQGGRGLRPLWDRLLLVHLQTCGTPNKAGNQKPRVYTAGGCNQRAKYKRISISRAWDETPGGTGKKKNKQNKIPNANASLCGSFKRDKGGRTTRQTQAGSVFVPGNVHVLRLRPPPPVLFILPVQVWKKPQFSRRRHRSARGGGGHRGPR